jgi:hypothetical protein
MSAGAQVAPVEEIRLAVVLNGGVSLAGWMGGVVQELNRRIWADPSATQACCGYASALNAAGSTPCPSPRPRPRHRVLRRCDERPP